MSWTGAWAFLLRQAGFPFDLLEAALVPGTLELPRHVFAKFAHEPRPVHLDWNAPLLVRQFFRLARAASPDDTVEISDMLSGPDLAQPGFWFDRDHLVDGGGIVAEAGAGADVDDPPGQPGQQRFAVGGHPAAFHGLAEPGGRSGRRPGC